MKVYKVKVNGKLYEVELESVSETKGSISVPEAPAPAKEAPAASSNGEGVKVLAPIGGKVVDVKVNVGDNVTKGQIIAVIEAMKLENEVPSTQSGVVKEIKIAKGNNVSNGDVIVILG